MSILFSTVSLSIYGTKPFKDSEVGQQSASSEKKMAILTFILPQSILTTSVKEATNFVLLSVNMLLIT